MKLKFLSIIAVAAMATLFGTTSCMDDHDAPNVEDYIEIGRAHV